MPDYVNDIQDEGYHNELFDEGYNIGRQKVFFKTAYIVQVLISFKKILMLHQEGKTHGVKNNCKNTVNHVKQEMTSVGRPEKTDNAPNRSDQ